MRAAIRIGISIRDYEDMTPHELNMCIEEYASAQQAKQNNGIALAWLNAYYQRVKKMPDIKKLIGGKAAKKREMTDEELLNQIRILNMQFGGKEVIRNAK